MLAIGILILGVCSRIFLHAPNFNPVIALALFGGVYLKRKYALWTPVLLMMISDLILGLHDMILFTWGSMILIAGIGILVRRYKGVVRILGASVLSSVIFYLITNFGSWLVMYPRTMEGLLSCYIAAIPFFRNTLFSTLLFSFVLFGLYEMIALKAKKTRFAERLLST